MSLLKKNPNKKETSKCVFKSCPNTGISALAKPNLHFFMFNTIPTPIRDEWTRIVARERGEPSFQPSSDSIMCSEHFNPLEIDKMSRIKVQNIAKKAFIPTIKIGPYDDSLLIEDDAGRDYSQGNDIVCIIENQIRTEEHEPQFTDEKEIDIEDQIQFSLVGKTKQFEGLINCDPGTTNTRMKNVQNSDDDKVVIIEDVKEIENSESEFVNQFSQFVNKRDKILKKRVISDVAVQKKPLNSTYYTISNSKQFTETKGLEGSHFHTHIANPFLSTITQAETRHVVAPHIAPTPQYVTKSVNATKSQEPLIKEENDVNDDVIIVAEDIEFDVSDDEIDQEYSGQYSQFLKKLNAGTVTKEKRWNSVEPKRKKVSDNSKTEINNQVTTTQPTSVLALQTFTSAPLYMMSPMLTIQNGAVQHLIQTTSMIATDTAEQVAAPQLVALIPSNGVQHNTLYRQNNNNIQTIFLSPVVSSTPQQVIDSEQGVTKQKKINFKQTKNYT